MAVSTLVPLVFVLFVVLGVSLAHSPKESTRGGHVVPTLLRRIGSNGQPLDRRHPDYSQPLRRPFRTASARDAEGFTLTASPSVLERSGGVVTVTWEPSAPVGGETLCATACEHAPQGSPLSLTMSSPSDSSDWIGLYCPPDADAHDFEVTPQRCVCSVCCDAHLAQHDGRFSPPCMCTVPGNPPATTLYDG